MNNKIKRYRQTSIIESFAFSKRQKTNHTTLNENTDRQFELAATSETTEKMMSSSLNVDESINICQAAEDSVEVKDEHDDKKMPNINTDTDKHCNDSSDFHNSDDLFPEVSPSLENYSLPSSSFSDELFTDSVANDSSGNLTTADSSGNPTTAEASDSEEPELLSYLNRTPDCCVPLPKLEPLENHTILFSPHIRPGDAPHPYPKAYRDVWDSDHVRMPCSPLNRYPVIDSRGDTSTQTDSWWNFIWQSLRRNVKSSKDLERGETHIDSQWNLICRSLRRSIESSKDLEDAIMKYNSQYIGRWNFLGLHDFINKHLEEAERDHFFEVILPVMIQITLDLPNICTQPLPLLKKKKDYYLTLSQKQIGCLLLNAFFCTYPRRTLPDKCNKHRWTHESATYPEINFNRLFYGDNNGIPPRNAEKLKCLFNYFRRITSEEPSGTVTFHRQSLRDDDLPKWHASTRGIRAAVIKSSGLIETDGHGMLQADFANEFVGGGVIGQGCVQEEIRFVICPELIISRLFVECLDSNEVLIVTGVEQYNKYSGYNDSFKWEGNFKDETPRDSWGRRYTQLVAMDAINFKNSDDQFKVQFLIRELNKAYCAFYENALPAHLSAVATGNWGCGAFKGNPNLKFLIQLMAASQTSRSLLYFTFGNKALKTQLQNMYNFLCDKNLSVGDVWRLLIRYAENVSLFNKAKHSNLYDFIYAQFLTKEENCRNPDDGSSAEPTFDDSEKKGNAKSYWRCYS